MAESGENDVVLAVQPGTESMWSKANSLKTPAPVVGLNAPFSLSYDIGYKPSVWEQIYVVKRLTKGTCISLRYLCVCVLLNALSFLI